MEIERKYLIKNLPLDLDDYSCSLIEQAYISTKPVIRARKRGYINNNQVSDVKYILTIKGSGLLTREEHELTLNEEEYNNLLTKAEGNVITKHRYVIPLEDSLTLELDVFKGLFEGLVMGEIEFQDEEVAKKYNPPEYLFREVTFDTRFHNSTMSSMSYKDILNFLNSLNVENC